MAFSGAFLDFLIETLRLVTEEEYGTFLGSVLLITVSFALIEIAE
jgi:hypothetical protein